MSESVFHRILKHGVYEVLLTSSDDGYTVRLTKALSSEERTSLPGYTRQPVRMTRPPAAIALQSPGAFFPARVAWRHELIGWIKAELSRDAVEPLFGMPLLPGQRQPSIGDFDFRMRVGGWRDAWPADTVVVPDDLADLDGPQYGPWRVPTEQDDWVRW
jgi:hypothetical protein